MLRRHSYRHFGSDVSYVCFMAEEAEVCEILAEYGLQPHEYEPLVAALRRNPQAWLDFMMNEQHHHFPKILHLPFFNPKTAHALRILFCSVPSCLLFCAVLLDAPLGFSSI
ncbi:Vacuolar iron transporter 1 [Dendrobium catenatum]|uniref:Vacuolar iron transporter n=1 Tax=Dendrobium catenatum TaxID=906689 RepID=A0A2I0XHC2_9ASPA|nr:Vacuolar iron transporter 1 [Dendrobium catenatum]